jgi:hypothetical protein
MLSLPKTIWKEFRMVVNSWSQICIYNLVIKKFDKIVFLWLEVWHVHPKSLAIQFIQFEHICEKIERLEIFVDVDKSRYDSNVLKKFI